MSIITSYSYIELALVAMAAFVIVFVAICYRQARRDYLAAVKKENSMAQSKEAQQLTKKSSRASARTV